MNKRIRQLALQASTTTTSYYDGRGNVTETYFNIEKFAELIVQEAIDVLQKRFMGDLNREDMEVRRCVDDVKKHFGVEQ